MNPERFKRLKANLDYKLAEVEVWVKSAALRVVTYNLIVIILPVIYNKFQITEKPER